MNNDEIEINKISEVKRANLKSKEEELYLKQIDIDKKNKEIDDKII